VELVPTCAGVLDPADPAALPALSDWLALQQSLALDPLNAAALLRASRGDPRRALAQAGLPPPTRRAVGGALASMRRCGARLVPFCAGGYPWRLALLRDAPAALAVRGDASLLGARGVAIVGARAASAYGRSVARRLARELAEAGLVIVSGLARGIDAAAHEGALDGGGRTLAIQACGIEQVYPPEHHRLADRIVESGGVLLTELPPGTPPRPPFFPLRNRMISALADALVVVEARERSGSLHTVRHALDQGIDVLAVPGPVDAPTSSGPNRLLRDGAAPALDASDVLAALAAAPGRSPEPRERLAPELEALLAALALEPASRDALARASALPPRALAAALLELELAGRIVEDRDGRLRIVP
jgi:DNA processing protein